MIDKYELNNLKAKAVEDIEMIMKKYDVKHISELSLDDLNEYDNELFEVASKVLLSCYHYEYIKEDNLKDIEMKIN